MLRLEVSNESKEGYLVPRARSPKSRDKNEDDKDDKQPTKRPRQELGKNPSAAVSKWNDGHYQVSMLTAVTKYGYHGTLLVGNGGPECKAIQIDLAQLTRESDPTGHLIQSLKAIKATNSNREINLCKFELNDLRDETAGQVARLTDRVAPHETAVSASEPPKLESTQQGLSYFVPHDSETLEQESPSSSGKALQDTEANLEDSSDEDNSSSTARIRMLPLACWVRPGQSMRMYVSPDLLSQIFPRPTEQDAGPSDTDS
ncbi:uncharacterized protein N7496_011451 [Penicillium cataractarum]|uniref:Uncharacterized protein n=1 Tax=Penicillium cataractarum TaxID=2100454 RepID=A0A9W9RK70_9EURO|nr:uncharacterized protein N7496_011451 [Penicillium cataractarum]KAJ5359038.1 hypothetical protein N7496_011451 [Penicillium cataractarum]